jgi:WD40 repeat protein
VARFRASAWQEHLVATGGTENDLAVWDLTASDRTTPAFKARNVPPTKLDLRVPVAITDVHFASADGTRLITGTAHHQVRVYDTKAARRPVLDVSVGAYPVKSLAVLPDGQYVRYPARAHALSIDGAHGAAPV